MLILMRQVPGGWKPLRVIDHDNIELVLEHYPDAERLAIARADILVEIDMPAGGLNADDATTVAAAALEASIRP